jgi:hypothetical protein
MSNIKSIKRTFHVILYISGFLIFFQLLMVIAGAGVLNDLDESLVEMKELEKKGLLNNPPETISYITKREITLVKNSQGLSKYISETEKTFNTNSKLLLYLFLIFIISAIIYLTWFHFADTNLNTLS